MTESKTGGPTTPVVITGGASGIGLACAEALAAAGRAVAIWDLDEGRCRSVAEAVAADHGVTAVGIGVDVRDLGAITAAADRSVEALGNVGALLHAAGISHAVPLDNMTEHDWDSVLDVNLKAFPFLVKALLPSLRSLAGSAVVGIGSINARLGSGMNPAYTASKGGLTALVRSLADGLAGDGIRVNSVSPGVISTPMVDAAVSEDMRAGMAARIFVGRFGLASEIAAVVCFLLSDEASYVTAADWLVDGGNVVSQR